MRGAAAGTVRAMSFEESPSGRAFKAAVEAGDVAALRALLEGDAEVRAEIDARCFEMGAPAVVVAARRGFAETQPALERTVHGELGVLRLARNDPRGALREFVAAQSWSDAAWIAERVLAIDEALDDYVQRRKREIAT